jgi:hypothetical protein
LSPPVLLDQLNTVGFNPYGFGVRCLTNYISHVQFHEYLRETLNTLKAYDREFATDALLEDRPSRKIR